eukprot:1818452-Amphidinium_carterae.2
MHLSMRSELEVAKPLMLAAVVELPGEGKIDMLRASTVHVRCLPFKLQGCGTWGHTQLESFEAVRHAGAMLKLPACDEQCFCTTGAKQ